MRLSWNSLLVWLLLILVMPAWAQQPPTTQVQQENRIYTNLVTDVSPEVRGGRTFVPLRAIAEQFAATVTWLPATEEVRIQRVTAPEIRLKIGSRQAQVGERTVTLDVAPFISQGRTMVPLRFISETYGIPVEYRVGTRSVLLYQTDRIYVLPLPSAASGIHIYDPQQGELLRNPIRVQGQANVYEGALTIEVQDSSGRVLGSTIATAGMGGFYAFSVPVYYNLPSDDPSNGRIVVYSMNGRGDGRILARDTVTVRLASTI
ncbi:MAG: stalk domain-containing protein [Armatimonadota bacterium]